MSKKIFIGVCIAATILLVGTLVFCMVTVPVTQVDIPVTEPTTAATEPVITEPIITEPTEATVPTEPIETTVPTEPVTEPTEPIVEEPAEWVYDDTLSASKNIFIYLTEYLGFPEPAACGIISNIAHETGWKFNPKAGNPNHCYGLIQWMGGRLNNLKKWCKKNGKDYKSIQGQLDFMYWELTENDPYGTYKYLMKCTDGKDSAYDAGWYFCYWYERPANTKARAKLRGRDAKDYYDKLVLGLD
jgi:hypothetical protein